MPSVKNNDRKLIKVVIPALLFFVVMMSLFSLSNNSTIISNLYKKYFEGNELLLDNWEISTVIYDSSVDEGNTPLTEINWDASDGGYGEGQTRIITIQINYKNTNCQNDYEIGDLYIYYPLLTVETSNLSIVRNISANDDSHTGYDWNAEYINNKYVKFTNNVKFSKQANFEGSIAISYILTPKSETPEMYDDECVHELLNRFKAVLVYSKSEQRINFSHSRGNFNFENNDYDCYLLTFSGGSLLVGRSITIESESETTYLANNSSKSIALTRFNPLLFQNNIKMYINDYNTSFNGYVLGYKTLAHSNTISFSYTRTYTHKWNKYEYEITKTVEEVTAYDGIENADNYIWVKYGFEVVDSRYDEYRGLTVYSKSDIPFYIYDELPSDVVVYSSGSKIDPYDGNTYRFSISGRASNVHGNFAHTTRKSYVYVGYPKSNYTNRTVTNSADLYVNYASDEEYIYKDSDSIEVELNNYIAGPSTGSYSISKSTVDNYIMSGTNACSGCGYPNYYQAIAEGNTSLFNGNLFGFTMDYSSIYTGKPQTVLLGDDYLSASIGDGQYEKLKDNEYYINTLKIRYIYDYYSNSISEKYNWKLYVRKANNTNFELYKENVKVESITFDPNDKVVEYYIKGENLNDSVVMKTYTYINVNKTNISQSGTLYNYAYLKVYEKDNNNNLVLKNNVTPEAYKSFNDKDNLISYDLNNDEDYIQRDSASKNWAYFNLTQPNTTISCKKVTDQNSINQDDEKQQFTLTYNITGTIKSGQGTSFIYNASYNNLYNDKYAISGIELIDLLPLGMSVDSTKEDIIDSLTLSLYNPSDKIFNTSFQNIISKDEFLNDYIIPNLSTNNIEINKNWNNTGRTRIKITISFGNEKFFLFGERNNYSNIAISVLLKTKISYDNYEEYGDTYLNEAFINNINNDSSSKNNSVVDSYDIDEDGDTSERISRVTNTTTIPSIVASHQDVQVSVKTGNEDYNSELTNTELNSEYTYKLRVRTGNNDITNLVIYDNIEKYMKDANMEFIEANGGRSSWQGEFLGIDTTYAESKGYTIKTYYSENEEVGSIKTDTSWREYTESVDKSKIKTLAFEYLDSEGNPAILPANSHTYVLINMKSISDNHTKTFAYNGCWTEWNAIDPITGQPVDFITGINSNVVRVGVPTSVEPVDIDYTVNKYWRDNNNQLSIRPDTINIQLIPNNDITQAINIPLGTTNVDNNNQNHWYKTVSVPKIDGDGETITYTIREGEIILENGYKYTPEITDNSITNVLTKEIELKKVWKDNNNSYLTRPGSVTYQIKQNNNPYKEVTITGDYSTNEWTKTITVPVYDSSNNEYTYTVEETSVNKYTSNCENYTCTNTLSENETITITKVWIDRNNEYSTRPNNITVHLLQNNINYQNVILSPTSWAKTVTVPKYDSNGVKYNYTITEDEVDEYGLVAYDQNNYKITNTLKEKINLVITKTWIDDNNSNNTRPDELTITLLRDGNFYKNLVLSGDTNVWTITEEVDKYDDNQRKYVYSIQELNDSIKDEYSNVTYGEDDLSVTNKLDKSTNLTVTKKWNDQNNKYLTRPNNVRINLLQNGEIYRELTITKENNWIEEINNIPVYDNNGAKYDYTIEEININPKYGNITYDQTTLEVTNELTEEPKVTLYFTVMNGYIDPTTQEIKYDEFGLKEILEKYKINIDDEYIFDLKLENVDTGKEYEGKLSTQGVLQFDNIPYGTYKVEEQKDILFEFFDMLSISDVDGVEFTKEGNIGYITIRPTGENIIFGAKIINKIEALINNPQTSNRIFISIGILMMLCMITLYVKKKRII